MASPVMGSTTTTPGRENWASEHYLESASYQSRLPIALILEPHTFQPSSSTSSPVYDNSTTTQQRQVTHRQGAGYGPPEPSTVLLDQIYNLLWTLDSAYSIKMAGREYDLVCLPLTNENWKLRWNSLCVDGSGGGGSGCMTSVDVVEAEKWRLSGHFRRNEVNISRQSEAVKCICIASQWLELDSEIEGIRLDSELALKQEVQYASYNHITTLLLPPPRNSNFISDYARAITSALLLSTSVTLSIQIPVSDVGHNMRLPDQNSSVGKLATWDDWEIIQRLCNYPKRLTISLDMTYFVHSSHLLSRWISEPVSSLYIPASSFIANAKGYPVLSRLEQTFIKGMLKYGPTMILGQVDRNLHKSGGPAAYVQYLRFLEKKVALPDPIEQFAGTVYLDHLQAPLQPLADHLESQTYTGFEMDPEKYHAYESAIYAALMDRPANKTIMVFVCGAGRGPLVEAALRASNRSGRIIRVKAVEKNPNVWTTLQERQETEWGSAVELVFADCRTFKPNERADILVTELLGSFGDNELSPECIDGAIRWLKPDGVSIPRSYTSYVAPLSSSKLHSRVTESGRSEMPYVVMIHKASIISSSDGPKPKPKIAEAWDFVHSATTEFAKDSNGLPITNSHNSRSAHLTFYIPNATVCHGFGGYFTAHLYGQVTLDIRPDQTMSRKMLSWFPIFFPFKEPLYIPGKSELDIQIWRLTEHSSRKVWYEWCAQVFLPSTSFIPTPTILQQHSPDITIPMSPPTNSYSPSVGVKSPNSNPNSSIISNPGTTASAFLPPQTPMVDAMLLQQHLVDGDNDEGDAGMNASATISRLKIASTSLHNPGGRVSSIGL